MNIDRRRFLTNTAAAGSILVGAPAWTIEPISRPDNSHMRLSLSAYSLRKFMSRPANPADELTLVGFIAYCANLGIDGAELTQYYFPAETSREYVFKLKQKAHHAGVDISGGAIGNNFTVEPGEKLEEQMRHLQTWIDHYADLGAPVIRVFAGKPPANVSTKEALSRAIAALEQACEMAGRRGVMLAIENHDFTTDVNHLMQIVDGVKSPWFGVNFDSGNLGHSEDPYADMIRMAPYAINAQLKVTIRSADGKQPADLPRVVSVLRDAGYRGYVALEYEEKEDPYVAIPRYVEQLRELLIK